MWNQFKILSILSNLDYESILENAKRALINSIVIRVQDILFFGQNLKIFKYSKLYNISENFVKICAI